MTNRLRLTVAALAPALAFTLLLPSAVSASSQEIEATSCPIEASAEPLKKKKKGLRLGGLLGAAKRAGVGHMLGGGVLGDSKAAQVAGLVAETAIEGGDAASVIVDAAASTAVAATDGGNAAEDVATVLADSGSTAQAVGVAAGLAIEVARRAPAKCQSAD